MGQVRFPDTQLLVDRIPSWPSLVCLLLLPLNV